MASRARKLDMTHLTLMRLCSRFHFCVVRKYHSFLREAFLYIRVGLTNRAETNIKDKDFFTKQLFSVSAVVDYKTSTEGRSKRVGSSKKSDTLRGEKNWMRVQVRT